MVGFGGVQLRSRVKRQSPTSPETGETLSSSAARRTSDDGLLPSKVAFVIALALVGLCIMLMFKLKPAVPELDVKRRKAPQPTNV